ncbi:MAG: ORF6N domain-containing protein [Planctomycetota bacterium]|nr:ORF6N domain-containing protein [Planctomycetota bacterium]
MTAETKLILVDQIEPLIHEIRGQKVVLDSDLAALYDVPTKVLNQAIQRKLDRFPPDFRFQLTESEMDSLRSQIVTSNIGRGGRRYLPYVFTEHGVVMAASVLNSPRAVEVSVFVVRAFVKLRQLVLAHSELAGKLDQLERKVGSHDEAIKQLVAAIRQLMAPAPAAPNNQLGFHTIRESAKGQSKPPKPTASKQSSKRKGRTVA